MNGAAQVLAELTAHGLRVRVEGDRLALSPPSALTPELRERALAHKRELLAMLASQRDERLSGGLALREVLGFRAAWLPGLPIATTLVLAVPGVTGPVLVATHAGCPRRSFTVAEWLKLAGLAEARDAEPQAFVRWAKGMSREQLSAVDVAALSGSTTVGEVLRQLGASLRVVVLEGEGP